MQPACCSTSLSREGAGLSFFYWEPTTTLVAVHKLGLAGHFTLSLHWYDFLRDDKISGRFIAASLRLHVEEKEQLILLGLIQDF